MGTQGRVTSLHFLFDSLSSIGDARVLTHDVLVESLELRKVLVELHQVFLEDVKSELQTVMGHEETFGCEVVRLFERQSSFVFGICGRNEHCLIQTCND